jgi:hypothetical protein
MDIPKLKALSSRTTPPSRQDRLGQVERRQGDRRGAADRAGERVCIIDPTGAWWGLRLKPDGSPSPFKVVIFGGLHADVPITGDHGAVVAEVVATSSTPAIIDTRPDDGRRAHPLLHRLRRDPAAQESRAAQSGDRRGARLRAPGQQGGRPAERQDAPRRQQPRQPRALVGLRISLITQRPAKLHKDSLTQVETMIALRVIHPLDRGGRGGVDQGMGRQGPGRRDRLLAALAADRRCVDMVARGRESSSAGTSRSPGPSTAASRSRTCRSCAHRPRQRPRDARQGRRDAGGERPQGAASGASPSLRTSCFATPPAPDYGPTSAKTWSPKQDDLKRLRRTSNAAMLDRAESIAACWTAPIIPCDLRHRPKSKFPRHIRGQTVEEAYVRAREAARATVS